MMVVLIKLRAEKYKGVLLPLQKIPHTIVKKT